MLKTWQKTLTDCCCVPQRLILAIMGFLAVVNAYTMRVCLNVAITQIVVSKNDSGTIEEGFCPILDEEEGGSSKGGEYDWSESLQGVILSSFFWGYVITHIPGGMLAEKYGGKWCLSLGILSTAIFTLLTPLAIEIGGANLLIALRFTEGLFEGTTFPALSALLSCWIPINERSKMGALVFAGAQIGTILSNSMSGILLHNYHWSSVFYFFGGLGVIWFILFTFLCYSSPSAHPFIKEREKEYLLREIGRLKRDETLPPAPWRKILVNAPMLALVVAQIGHDWGFFVMVTDLPKYMSDVLHFSIKNNGLYSSLPYVLMWLVALSSGVLGDWLIKNGKISITNSRKLFTSIASMGPAIFIMFASYAGCSKTMAVVYFTIAMGLMGTYYPGMKVNPLDLSPNYAGSLMALTNGAAATAGIISPILIGLMTPNRSLLEWRRVFWISLVIFAVTNLVYVIWASGEVQDFNDPKLLNKEEAGLETPKKEKENKTSKVANSE